MCEVWYKITSGKNKKKKKELYSEHFLCKCNNIVNLFNDVTCKSLCEIILAEANQI